MDSDIQIELKTSAILQQLQAHRLGYPMYWNGRYMGDLMG